MKARRIRENGEIDPNAVAKDAAEAVLFEAMRARLNGQFRGVMELLGDPPDFSRLDDEFWRSETGQMIAVLRPRVEQMALEAVAAQAASVPVLWDEAVIAAEAAAWAERYVYDLVEGINANTRNLLREQVRRFIETPGMTVGDLRRELTPAFGESRAQAIAVTETTRAFSEGERLVQDGLRRGGLEMEAHWNTSRDEKVCPLCGPLDGLPEREWAAHRVSSGPPLHPNCRCWITLRRRRD
jgi:hypothetical protein